MPAEQAIGQAAEKIGGMIKTGAGVLGNIIMAKKQQQWAQKMYDQQRAHALADWEMQNAYNSPAAQMKRLKDAGLNPHLVYGNGADATSNQMPRSSDAPNAQLDALQFEGYAPNLSQFYDTQVKQAQTDNLKAQTVTAVEDAKLRAAQTLETYARTANTVQQTSKGDWDLKLAKELKDVTIDAAKTNVMKMKADLDYTQAENRRKEDLHQGNLTQQQNQIKQQVQEIISQDLQQARTRSEIKNIETQGRIMLSDEQIKQIELDLRKKNLTPNSPLWQKEMKSAWERIKERGFGLDMFKRQLPTNTETKWAPER